MASQYSKGTYKKAENKAFSRACCNRTSSNSFKLKGRFRLVIKKEFFYNEGSKTIEQVVQKGGRCSAPGNIQGRIEQGSEQPDHEEDDPAHFKVVGLDDLYKAPSKPFYNSMKNEIIFQMLMNISILC